MAELDPVLLSSLYRWVDTIPLDRPKKNIARDFSDGVLMSQIIYHFFPRIVELHNYSSTHSVEQKIYNWKTLNQKVFKKMGFMLSPTDIDAVVQCKKHAIERVLLLIQGKITEYQNKLTEQSQQRPNQPVDEFPEHAPSPKSSSSSSSYSQSQSSSTPASSSSSISAAVAQQLSEKDATIQDLKETNEILQLKVSKLEQLLRLKNSKIASLQKRLDELSSLPSSEQNYNSAQNNYNGQQYHQGY